MHYVGHAHWVQPVASSRDFGERCVRLLASRGRGVLELEAVAVSS